MEKPTLFSVKLPTLQLAWDATSLRALMFCPRFYDLTVRLGWRRDAVDLEFGILAHSAMECYDKALWEGKSWEEAQFAAVEYALKVSGSYVLGPETGETSPVHGGKEHSQTWVPWGGRYEPMWKCSGEKKYVGPDGKKGKKCPYAFSKVWVPGHGPHVCSECGSHTIQEDRWLPAKPGKDRHSLIRTVAWWCEELKGSPIKTLTLPDGKPAVEINFQIGLPWAFGYTSEWNGIVHFETDGKTFVPEELERFILCGYFDGAVEVGAENFVKERKTTKSTLGKQYWSGFSPNVQIDTYHLATKYLPALEPYNIRGVLVESAQTLDGGSRFGHQLLYRTPDQDAEHLEQIGYWLERAVAYAQKGEWPMAKAQCPMCPMKGVCSKERGKREDLLKADFKQYVWNPLEER